ncbi:protein-serine O-palmitoleoyltransferase porcupine-like isoform X2 [Watersipora subatra]
MIGGEQTIEALYNNCIIPNLTSAMENVVPLLVICLLCSIVARCQNRYVKHSLSAALGVYALYWFFTWNSLILVPYGLLACVLLQYKRLRNRVGALLSSLTLIFVIACEFIIPAENWHNVRGAQMVLSMKVISLGFDLANESVKSAPLLEMISYLLHPGSVIFGPWISYQYYVNGVSYKRQWFDWRWLCYIIKSFSLAVIYLTWSSCLSSFLIQPATWGRWPDAYRDAQSFRMSHYFVCSLAEATLLLSGVGEYNGDGELSNHVQVSEPLNIELPRSLVEVVTSWNLPMHKWLRNYVFRIARPKYGAFSAILLTYASSSLLHGLNFQLAAVLLSLGIYSYIEHSLRQILAKALSLCIESKQCDQCSHKYKRFHIGSIVVNILFTCVAMYHLAYLGVMFDTSESGGQEKGYSMVHTLRKWRKLGYASHIFALCTYAFYWLVK